MSSDTTVKSDQATRYLLYNDWVILPSKRDDVLYFGVKNPRDLTWLAIPKYDRSSYWKRMLRHTGGVLSMVEKRPVKKVLDDLLHSCSDRLSFRINSSAVASCSIPLSSFHKLFSAITNILKAAVKDIESSEHQHKRLSGKAVKKLMDSAQFGQTGQGSFVFNIYLPVVEADSSLNMYRDVLIHILNSFSSAVDEKWEKKASTNLYRALWAMDLWEDTEVEIAVKWSPLAKPSKYTRSATKVGKAVFGRIKEDIDAR